MMYVHYDLSDLGLSDFDVLQPVSKVKHIYTFFYSTLKL